MSVTRLPDIQLNVLKMLGASLDFWRACMTILVVYWPLCSDCVFIVLKKLFAKLWLFTWV